MARAILASRQLELTIESAVAVCNELNIVFTIALDRISYYSRKACSNMR